MVLTYKKGGVPCDAWICRDLFSHIHRLRRALSCLYLQSFCLLILQSLPGLAAALSDALHGQLNPFAGKVNAHYLYVYDISYMHGFERMPDKPVTNLGNMY